MSLGHPVIGYRVAAGYLVAAGCLVAAILPPVFGCRDLGFGVGGCGSGFRAWGW